MNQTQSAEEIVLAVAHEFEQAKTDIGHLSGELEKLDHAIKAMQKACEGASHSCHASIAELMHEVEQAQAELVADLSRIDHSSQEFVLRLEHELESADAEKDHLLKAMQSLQTSIQHGQTQLSNEATALDHRNKSSAEKLVQLADQFHAKATTAESRYVTEAHSVAQSVSKAHQDAHGYLKEVLQGARDTHISQRVQQGITELEAQMDSFATAMSGHGEQFKSRTQEMLNRHHDEQEQSFQQMITDAQHIGSSVEALVKSVSDLAGTGVTATHEVLDAMDTVNVGLKVTIGTLQNIRDVVAEIGL